MARKVCPECKAVTGASTTTCKRCGHTFEVTALAEPSRVRRCAMCGLTNLASTTKCQCGFDFEQAPEDLRAFYTSRRRNAWVLLTGGVMLGIVGSTMSMLLGLEPLIVTGVAATLGASAAVCRKALRILGATRTNLEELAAFPHARVVQMLPTTASRNPSAPGDTPGATD